MTKSNVIPFNSLVGKIQPDEFDEMEYRCHPKEKRYFSLTDVIDQYSDDIESFFDDIETFANDNIQYHEGKARMFKKLKKYAEKMNN